MPPKKLKSVNATVPVSTSGPTFGYKHFNSANSKRRKNRKKYFEHDTRTRTIRTSVATNPIGNGGGGNGGAAAIKKIKFNNEIRIVETKCQNDVDNIKGKMKKKPQNKHAMSNAQKKRAIFRRTTSAASNAASIQSTTKKLQKQLLETQKKLQKQLNALQEHQREQNHSFLALLHSNCMHNAKHDNNIDGTANIDSKQQQQPQQQSQQQSPQQLITQANSTSNLLTKSLNQNPCSEHYFTHTNFFTDQSKCSIDKMANGNKVTAIRAFTCESKSKNCSVSNADPDAKPLTPPNVDLCTHHHCSSCIGYSAKSVVAVAAGVVDTKKPKNQIKKPLLKSIILSTTNNSPSVLNIKREINDSNECDRTICPIAFNSLTPMTKTPETKSQPIDMQFTDTKKTKQINSYFKSNDNFVQQQQNARSYSPPLPTNHRLASMITNDSTNVGGGGAERSQTRHRSHSSRDRKCSKKRKKRRRSYSRDSRSRSRSYSRSRSSTRSRSRSRSRSYRRRSSRSRSSNSEYETRRYSQERKKKSHSKNRDVFRRSSKRDERNSGCGCSCNCTNYCKKSSSKRSTSAKKSKSPSNDSAFSSKQSNISPSDSKSNKRSTSSSGDANGSTSKKKAVTINSGGLLKQQPIVKLDILEDSDTENEVDDKFDRKYEELLTFETNEDERREQRLLKALSDIAAKAKQKIQSISSDSTGVTKIVHPDRNHNERSTSKSNNKTIKYCSKKSNESHDEHRSERQASEERYDNDYSPHESRKHTTKRASSKRSRRESSYSSSSSKEEKSTRSSRSPSIPRRRGSPSFLDRRRITSARKKPIPYQRSSPYDSLDEWESS